MGMLLPSMADGMPDDSERARNRRLVEQSSVLRQRHHRLHLHGAGAGERARVLRHAVRPIGHNRVLDSLRGAAGGTRPGSPAPSCAGSRPPPPAYRTSATLPPGGDGMRGHRRPGATRSSAPSPTTTGASCVGELWRVRTGARTGALAEPKSRHLMRVSLPLRYRGIRHSPRRETADRAVPVDFR